jgi:hypothetical protein
VPVTIMVVAGFLVRSHQPRWSGGSMFGMPSSIG